MAFLPLVAKRFLLSKTNDGFLSLISWVSTFGVALGVLALVVVTSVINGFKKQLETTITGMNGDVILYTRGNPVTDVEAIEKKVRSISPQVSAITASFITELMVSGPKGVAGAVLEGFDPETLGRVTLVPQRVSKGRLPAMPAVWDLESKAEIALGSAIAERIGAQVGSQVRLVAPFVGDGPDQAKLKEAVVVGIVEMGMHQYDSKFVFAALPVVQKFLSYPGAVTSFKIKLREYSTTAQAREVAQRLGEHFGYPFRAKDWAQLNRNLLYAIELEKVVLSIILAAIVVVAAFNVVSALMMMIHEKGSEIAILKAMGMRSGQSWVLFVWMGSAIGLVGTSAGMLGGWGFNQLLKKYRWIELPPDVYYIHFLPVVERWDELLWVAVFSVLLCVAASFVPAHLVARKGILEGIRSDS